jgi:signal peptidase I
MEPTLHIGDRLLLDPRAFRSHPPQLGEIVVFVDPEGSGTWFIKRIARPPRPIPSGTLWLLGDEPKSSRDSRQFGPVHIIALRGRAWFRYAPFERRGPL